MQFDFDRFSKLAAMVYDGGEYTLNECLQVFKDYFEAYEAHAGGIHPGIHPAQIKRIIDKMPYLENENGKGVVLPPECYSVLIEKHFATKYRNCNYRINHFFSGRIRDMRFLETLY